MQKIQIIGKLGKDCEFDPSRGYFKFSVACDSKVKEGDTWVPTVTWYSVVRWTKKGEARPKICDYLKKGAGVFVSGDISLKDYEGKSYLNVNADNLVITAFIKDSNIAPALTPTESSPTDDLPF